MPSESRTIETNISCSNLKDIISEFLYKNSIVNDDEDIGDISIGGQPLEVGKTLTLRYTINKEEVGADKQENG